MTIRHPGDDINDTGGGWSDYNQPVLAAADGMVVYVRKVLNRSENGQAITTNRWLDLVGAPSSVARNDPSIFEDNDKDVANAWVGVVIQHYYLGKLYYSLYGHIAKIDRIAAQVGQPICKATQIGLVSKIGTKFPHLHFEIRNGYFDPLNEPKGYRPWNERGFCSASSTAYVDARYLDPVPFVDGHTAYPDILAREIAATLASDTRFGAASSALFTVSLATAQTNYHEIRKISYGFSGNRTVDVYHYLNTFDETRRSIAYFDPDSGATVPRDTLKLD